MSPKGPKNSLLKGNWLTGKSVNPVYQMELEFAQSILRKNSYNERQVHTLWEKIDRVLQQHHENLTRSNPELNQKNIMAQVRTGLKYHGSDALPRMGDMELHDARLLGEWMKEDKNIQNLFREYEAMILFAVISLHEAAVGREKGFKDAISHIHMAEKGRLRIDANKLQKTREYGRKGGKKSSYDKILQELIDFLYLKARRKGLKPTLSDVLEPLSNTCSLASLDADTLGADHLWNEIHDIYTEGGKLYWKNRFDTPKKRRISTLYKYLNRSKKLDQ